MKEKFLSDVEVYIELVKAFNALYEAEAKTVKGTRALRAGYEALGNIAAAHKMSSGITDEDLKPFT